MPVLRRPERGQRRLRQRFQILHILAPQAQVFLRRRHSRGHPPLVSPVVLGLVDRAERLEALAVPLELRLRRRRIGRGSNGMCTCSRLEVLRGGKFHGPRS